MTQSQDGGSRSWREELRSLPGALKAAATLIAAVLGVLFLLVPSLRPLSRDQIGATVTVPTIEGCVSELAWVVRQYPGDDPTRKLTELIGKPFDENVNGYIRGMVVYVGLKVEGFQHRSIELRARIYDASTKNVATNANLKEIYPKADHVGVNAPSRASVQLMLLTDLTRYQGRYFVRVEAYDKNGILGYADSPTIGTGSRTPPGCPRQ